MSTEKIANRQLFFILFMMRTTLVIAFLPVITSADALQDAWLSAVISFFGAAVLVCVIGGLTIRFPQETLVQYSQKLLSRWPGKFLSLTPLYAFLFMAATDSRIYAEALVTSFLPETPLAFVLSGMVLAAALAAYSGIETIGRSADIFFPLFIAMVLVSLLAPLPQAGILIRNIEPVLGRGLGPVLRGAIAPVSVISHFMVITILTPSTTEPKRVLRTALGSLAASSAVLVLAAVLVTITLGPVRASRTTFPFLSMIRAIHLSDFLERMEVLVVFAWGFGIFISLSVFLFCGARGLSQVLGMKTYRPLIGPMAAIWVAFGVHAYTDIFQIRAVFAPEYVFPEAALGHILLPMGILWAAYAFRAFLRRFQSGG